MPEHGMSELCVMLQQHISADDCRCLADTKRRGSSRPVRAFVCMIKQTLANRQQLALCIERVIPFHVTVSGRYSP